MLEISTPRFGALALAAALAAPLQAQDLAEPGFARTALRSLGNTTTVFAALSNGNVVRFDGTSADLETEDGMFLMSLGSLPGFAFPSFLVVDPTETFALLGESSNGDIIRIDLAGGGMTTIANFQFNFALTFETPGTVFINQGVEVPPGSFNFDTHIHRMSPVTGASRLVATVTGASGGLAVDAIGALYCADAVDAFGSTFDVIRWTASQLQSGIVLDETLATTIVAGLPGGASLALEPTNGHLFVAAGCELLEVDPVAGMVLGPVAAFPTCPAFTFFLSGLQILPGNNGATLQAFQPAGPQLRYVSTDFSMSMSDYVTLEAARPTFEITEDMGLTVLSVTGGMPAGTWNIIWNPVGDFNPRESVYDIGLGFPLFTGMDISKLFRLPFNLPLDASGNGSLTYHDPSVVGTFAFQAILYTVGGKVLGTSNGATN